MMFEIIENGRLIYAIEELLRKGLRLASFKEVWTLRKEGKIPMQWYDTGTLVYKGNIRSVTLEELKNIKEIYKSGGRLLCLGSVGNYNISNAYDYDILVSNNGRLVGVRPEAGKKKRIK